MFNLTDQLGGQSLTAGRKRPDFEKPRSINIDKRGTDLTITWSWFNWGLLFLAFFCTLWDGFLVFWYMTALSAKPIVWIALVFPLGHMAVGIGLTYFTLAGFLNKTSIRVTRGRVSVSHGPLPWPGALSIPVSEIEQFFVTEKVGSKGSRSYNLCMLDKNNVRKEFLKLNSEDLAGFIEQALEKHLKIENRAVTGEHLG